jgi:hypothetical protein
MDIPMDIPMDAPMDIPRDFRTASLEDIPGS